MNKSRIISWLGLGLSLVAVILLLKALQLNRVVDALAAAKFAWLIPAVLVSLLSFVWRALRFRLLLARLVVFPLTRSYQYIAINYMGNNVLPARAGEVLLSYVVRQQEGIGLSASLAVTVLGRVSDGLLLLIILLGTLMVLPFPAWVDQIVIVGFVVFGLAFSGLLWLVFGQPAHHSALRHLVGRLLPGWLERVHGWVSRLAKGFQDGLLSLKDRRVVAWSLILSLAIWFCEGLVYVLVGWAVGIELSIWRWLFTLALVNLATTVPSGPASLGTFEGVVVVALSLAGIPIDRAAAYALLLHATQVVPVTLVGALSYAHLSVRGVLNRQPS